MQLVAHPLSLRRWTVLLLLAAVLSFAAPAIAQQLEQAPPPEVLPAQPVQSPLPARALTLDECVAVGLQRQPAILAARATLASAETNAAALQHMGLAGLLARDLHIRRQQADLGVSIAQAGLAQAEWETVYAVTRCYWGWVFAQEQQKEVTEAIERLTDLTRAFENKAIKLRVEVNIAQLEVKRAQTEAGVERALAALREAMGLEAGCPVNLVYQPLPPLQEGIQKGALCPLALTRRGEMISVTTAAQVLELEIAAQQAQCGVLGRTFALGNDIHSRPVPQGISNREYRPGAIGIEMPVNMAGRRCDRVQRAQDLAGRGGAVVEKTRNLIVLELEDAYLRWQEAVAQVKSLRPRLENLPELIKYTSRQEFNSEPEKAEALTRVRRLKQEMQASLNDALYQHVLALTALERITAGGFQPAFRSHVLTASGHHPEVVPQP